jgi:hypothetical protein
MNTLTRGGEGLTVKRPVKRRAAHVPKQGHILNPFARVDQLAGLGDLLPGEFRLAPEFHAPFTLPASTPSFACRRFGRPWRCGRNRISCLHIGT